MDNRIPIDQLFRACNPASLPFKTSQEAPLPKRIIGQERAEKSMEFGLAIQSKGYNMFLVGPRGTGKSSIIDSLVRQVAATKPVPDDWCLVYNFADPQEPRAIRFPAGQALGFKKQMEEFLKSLQETVTRLFESKDFEEKRSNLISEFQERETKLLRDLEELAARRGFLIRKSEFGFATIPVVRDHPITPEEYAKLSEREKDDLKQKKEVLDEAIREAARKARKLERTTRDKIRDLERKTVSYALDQRLEDLQDDYKDLAEVTEYLHSVRENVLETIDDFKKKSEPANVVALENPEATNPWIRYQTNVLVDNSQTKGAPVIVDHNPTYYNLFGKMERRALFGTLVTDFTMIRSGSFLRANGGYLVLSAKDTLKNPFAWDGLKRAIQNSNVQIEDMAQDYAVISTAGIRPQAIPVDVKVILMGDNQIYRLLHSLDEDFREMFKVEVNFDYEMERSKEAEVSYASFIRRIVETEHLLPMDMSAVAAVIEFGSRQVENQDKLSTQFSAISDIVRESHFWASQNGHKLVNAADVRRALDERLYRVSLISEKFQEWLKTGVLLVDTEGAVVGQVNGLSVYTLGDFMFGRPGRVTATTYASESGVLNIERESRLSGRLHDKGILILSGFVSEHFSSDKPVSLGASVCFEQNYDEIEGDSASSAELLAILSSLADVPLSQGIAVTGSINQKGEIQPIGGVNYKIEGFFELCRMRGLNGKQGVIIPHQNTKHLMLKPAVIKAAKEGKFQIYQVAHISEAVEILTGVPAEKVFQKANDKVQRFAELQKTHR